MKELSLFGFRDREGWLWQARLQIPRPPSRVPWLAQSSSRRWPRKSADSAVPAALGSALSTGTHAEGPLPSDLGVNLSALQTVLSPI